MGRRAQILGICDPENPKIRSHGRRYEVDSRQLYDFCWNPRTSISNSFGFIHACIW